MPAPHFRRNVRRRLSAAEHDENLQYLIDLATAGGAGELVTKESIGLGAVENIAPADMPVSGPQATALAQKADATQTLEAIANANAQSVLAKNAADAASLEAAAAADDAADALAAANAAAASADGKAPLSHQHDMTDIALLVEEISDLKGRLDSLEGAGVIAQFASNGWSLTTGTGPGELIVNIITLPSATVPISFISVLVDGVATLYPLAASITITSTTVGGTETVQIKGTSGDQPSAVSGIFSEPKNQTTGAATVPAEFDENDWTFSGGSGAEMVSVGILGLPFDGGSTLTKIQLQLDGGSWADLPSPTLGSYSMPATGLSGSVSGRLRAVNAVGNGPQSSTPKNATVPVGATKPAQFAANQWSFGNGILPGSVAFVISTLPGNGGSAFTAMEYTIDGGSNWIAFSAMTAGTYQITGFTAGQALTAAIRMVNAIDPADPSANKSTTATAGSVVIGGVETMVGDIKVHTLTASGDVEVHGLPQIVDYELVAPGGSGGNGRGGGGGAGDIKRSSDAGAGPLTLTVGTHAYVHGAKGIAPAVTNIRGNSGGNSSFFGITANGGGGGAGEAGIPGESGGSGGGGRGGDTGNSSSGGAAIGGNANPGGAGSTSANTAQQHGGGGGGAGSAGADATLNAAGVGGDGEASQCPGVTTIYSGGGGGCRNVSTLDGALGGNGGTTGGRGAGGAISGNVATAGQTPGSGGGGGGGTGRFAGDGAEGLLHFWYAVGRPPVAPADVTVTSAAQLTTALTNVPANLARRYIIDLDDANYGNYTIANNYNKGTTLVQLRSKSTINPAQFQSIRSTGARNIELEGLRCWRTALDRWGYGDGAVIQFENVRGTGVHRCAIRNCSVRGGSRGIYVKQCWNLDISFNEVMGASVDQIALASDGEGLRCENLRVNNNKITSFHPTQTYRDISATIGYTLELNEATDPRRSDQENGNFAVQDLDDIMVPVADGPNTVAGTRGSRHPDLIQLWALHINTVIEDNYMWCGNVYRHGILYQNAVGQSAAFATGLIIRRNEIMISHVNGITLARIYNPIIDSNYLHRQPSSLGPNGWGLNYHKGIKGQGIMLVHITNVNLNVDRGTNPVSIVIATNNGLPAEYTTNTHNPALMTTNGGAPNVIGGTPVGWAGFDVPNNRIGPYGYEN